MALEVNKTPEGQKVPGQHTKLGVRSNAAGFLTHASQEDVGLPPVRSQYGVESLETQRMNPCRCVRCTHQLQCIHNTSRGEPP
jgi:hypothetical protein